MTNIDVSNINQENTFPKGILQFFSVTNVENTAEALSIFFHACMLEVGFLPTKIDEKNIYICLPEGWKASGAWKFQYYHKTCKDLFCWMTCVPLYSYVAVHGSLDQGHSNKTIYIKLKVANYLNGKENLADPQNIFFKCDKLVRLFKDEFCFPLLAQLQESAGCEPSFGLSITVDEIKLKILKLLPVQSVLFLSSVNKDFNRVASSSVLWKYLLERDFGLVDYSASATKENYYELYKKEYLKKRQRARISFPITNPYFLPAIYPSYPHGYVDPRIDLDPAIQEAFPQLRDHLRRVFPPYDFFGWYM